MNAFLRWLRLDSGMAVCVRLFAISYIAETERGLQIVFDAGNYLDIPNSDENRLALAPWLGPLPERRDLVASERNR